MNITYYEYMSLVNVMRTNSHQPMLPKQMVNNNQAVSLKLFQTDTSQTTTTSRSFQLRTGSSTF